VLAEALVASNTISESNEVIKGAGIIKDVIKVGRIEEAKTSCSGKEELGVMHTCIKCEVKRPREY
jgi:hypothetical protein